VAEGLTALKELALQLGDANPVGHHITNVVLTEEGDGEVRALSKGIGIMADGSCGSGTYEDRIVHTPAGWRIAHRTVHARRVPLGG